MKTEIWHPKCSTRAEYCRSRSSKYYFILWCFREEHRRADEEEHWIVSKVDNRWVSYGLNTYVLGMPDAVLMSKRVSGLFCDMANKGLIGRIE